MGVKHGLCTIGLLVVVASCGGASSDPEAPPSAKAPAPDPVSVSFPEITIPPGTEKTECVVLRLGNPTPIHVGAIHNVLGTGSHHLIVYRVSDTEEQRTPFECFPFTDTLDATKGSPLIVTQKEDDLLTLPEGVGYTLEANQMLRLEMHYINPAAQPKTITATTTIIPISDDDYRDEADFLFIGNPDISIPPMATRTLGPTFFQLPSELTDAKFFAMTGHQHQFGTNVQVATAVDREDPGTMVYDVPGWRWNEPKTEVFSPPLVVPPGGGFKFTCTWKNTTSRTLYFGESANDEMCFFWAYYYPSQGPKVCIYTERVGDADGLSLCCPGHPLCAVAKEMLENR